MTTQHPSIDKQLERLPPLPVTVTRVLHVTANPESSANDLMKAILPDQTMCVTILRVANSALYGRPKKVASLEKAIVVLGFDEIRSIVLGKAALTTFRDMLRNHQAELEGFWDHAFTCGLAARIIAEYIGLQSGQFFMAGLLHDFGKLAMLLAFPGKYEIRNWMTALSDGRLLKQEMADFGVSHAVVGSRLLQHWQFPDTLISALRHHHQPNQAGSHCGYALVVQLADFLAHCCNAEEKPNETTLKELLAEQLPAFVEQWRQGKLPWEETTLEYLFAWLWVDRSHGRAILDILATR
ncbi:HDOD domain-containing protein [Desulfofustis limnaeus]|jgi:HD-like signal output (HDOD) protein|uniref:HDOD domain-containing protein n=1 Tax=Desulfofustis limnaeus TaxID=2740163 RepID=A0ABM7WED0_9BACT|nr:HDOD domain-containing protein [Desulfofustis limnaeus]MDX9895959.1 HDOD domain-containing protein [Desulfofustis sp.]BDD89330.1 hypothetical protein DPPLL_36950 [Desulfofustis limnaeus]